MSKRPLEKYRYKQYLYKLTFPNGMVYIGVAYDVNERWRNEGAGYKGQRVWEAIQEFGWENVEHEILLHLPLPEENAWRSSGTLRKLETELIHAYGDRCYNRMGTQPFHSEIARKAREQGAYRPKTYWMIDGIECPAVDYCKKNGLNYSGIARKISKYGISPEQAASLPKVPKNLTRDPVSYWESLGFHFFEEYKARSLEA